MQKRVAAIHDISGFGKCSLTVALPIISAAGVETAVIPTAVLSTHTGGLGKFTYRDLTDDITAVAEHWKSLGLHFDAIYTGYLGSFRQIELVRNIIDMLRDDGTLVVVDPVMADNGLLYANFPQNFPSGMRELCGDADIILPNMTEAALMLGTEYNAGPYEEKFIEQLLVSMKQICGGTTVLTGVSFDNVKLGAACLNGDKAEYAFSDRVDAMYHGTGDVFGSALVGSLVNGKSLKEAMQIAADYTAGCIRRTAQTLPDCKYGVDFEEELPQYLKMLGKM